MKKRVVLQRKLINKELREAIEYPLTAIVAPMGFGKTTAVKDFLNNVRGEHIWLTINQDEESPELLWNLALEQVARSNPKFAIDLNQMGFPSNQLQQNKVFRLIEEHSIKERLILVIDDYQHVQSQAFNEFIEMSVRYRIANTSIILMSRNPINLQVDDLELKGFCKIIDPDVWLLTKEEIRKYCSMHQVFPNKTMIDKVYEQSEGWITAVCLLIHHYTQHGKFEFDSKLERLIEHAIEVDLSKDELHTLLKLSVLEEFTLEQALYIVDKPLAHDKICSVCENYGLIMYNHDSNEYRFQRIIRAYLNRIFKTTYDQSTKRAIYQRSGEYLLLHGKKWKGLKQLWMAGAYEQILGVFEKPKNVKLMERNPRMVVEIFSAIPEELKLQFPIAYITYIGFYLTHIDRDGGKKMLKGIELHMNQQQNLSSEVWNWIQGEIEMMKGFLEFNDVYKMTEHHEKASSWLQKTALRASKEGNSTYGSIHILYMYHRVPGGLQDTSMYIKEYYQTHQLITEGGGRGLGNQVMAEYYLETGDYEQAIIQALKAMCKAQQKQEDITLCARFTLIRSFIGSGDPEQALDCIAEFKLARDRCCQPILMCSYDLAIGYISYILQDERGFAEWIKNEEFDKSEVLYEGRGFAYIVAGQSLLMKEEYIKLEVLVEEMMPVFHKFNHIFGYIHSYILDAIAKFHLYGYEEAVDSLKAGLDYAKDDDVLSSICEYGKDLYALLKHHQNQNGNDLFVKKLVQQMNRRMEKRKLLDDLFGHAIILTSREKEVVRLLLEGKSNREIATELFVAEITIKKHMSAIYKKLGVKGRALAVKKCVELNIL